MGSVEKVEFDFDEELHFSSATNPGNVHAFQSETTQVLSSVNLASSSIFKQIGIRPIRSIYVVLIKAKINMLLPFGPLAILLNYLTGNHGLVLLFTLLGITHLAERLGYATEQLAFFTGRTVRGLLNATFGSATEMIVSIYALKNGMIMVVQQNLLGSILSNMLLVLGCAFLTGGIVHHQKVQVFNKASAVANSGLLLMAVMGILFPAVLHFTHSYVHFGKSEEGDTSEDPDEEEECELTKWEAIGWLAILTAWVSILSGYLVDAMQITKWRKLSHTSDSPRNQWLSCFIFLKNLVRGLFKGASESWNVPVSFISLILLPIVEHTRAIMFAMKDKLDSTLEVAIGSSARTSMFVIPFCVVVGWCMGEPMDLNFQIFETAALFISVLIVAFMLQDGTSHYFKGWVLILCYLIVAASSFIHTDPKNSEFST